VADRGVDLEAIAYDAGIHEQAGDFLAAEARDLCGIEPGKGGPIVFAFPQYGVPAQAGLRAFENEKLEPLAVVVYRHAPFAVVVDGEAVVRFGPGAALQLPR